MCVTEGILKLYIFFLEIVYVGGIQEILTRASVALGQICSVTELILGVHFLIFLSKRKNVTFECEYFPFLKYLFSRLSYNLM